MPITGLVASARPGPAYGTIAAKSQSVEAASGWADIGLIIPFGFGDTGLIMAIGFGDAGLIRPVGAPDDGLID